MTIPTQETGAPATTRDARNHNTHNSEGAINIMHETTTDHAHRPFTAEEHRRISELIAGLGEVAAAIREEIESLDEWIAREVAAVNGYASVTGAGR